MEAHSPEEVQKHVNLYMKVFAALLVLTVVTVAVSKLDLGHTGNIAVALIIALFKASLVAAFFMHLSNERKLIYWTLVLTVAFFIALMGLPVITLNDNVAGTDHQRIDIGVMHHSHSEEKGHGHGGEGHDEEEASEEEDLDLG